MTILTRRRTLELLAASGATTLLGSGVLGCEVRQDGPSRGRASADLPPDTTGGDAIARIEPLRGSPWPTEDPFLFCAHHLDAYPPGNTAMGPAASLAGRRIGRDFDNRDGWNMYHGDEVPGFPRHPHRGFETVSVVQTGLLDHSDSLGATARYGEGDVQWLTAGGGIQHAEMFPLVQQRSDNPLEMFQIWLNLPAAKKMVDAHFSMLWAPTIPTREIADVTGRTTHVKVVAGRLGDATAPAAPPASYASETDAHVAIWTLELEPGARFTLPAAPSTAKRSLYFYRGSGLRVGGRAVPDSSRVVLHAGSDVALTAGAGPAEILLLQGKPIGEPVARHGPFVMNSDTEIRQAYADYQRTQFGGWPWRDDDPVHPRTDERFARRPDGTIERPT